MSRYTFKKHPARNNNDGYESGYESEGGTLYRFKKTLGSGVYSQGRRFDSLNGRKSKVVLNPIIYNTDEITAKYNFFKTIYPEHQIKLIQTRNTYRLIVPLVPGEPYHSVNLLNQKQQITLFLSAIHALMDSHKKGYAVIDLKADNIYYDIYTEKSYLIDGGLAAKIGEEYVRPSIFRQPSEKSVKYYQSKHFHLAPECWSTLEVIASKTMDIYSLGAMMHRILESKEPDIRLVNLIMQCIEKAPEARPTLDELEKQAILLLKQIEPKHDARNTINNIINTIKTVDETKLKSFVNIENMRSSLLHEVNTIFSNNYSAQQLESAFETLGLNRDSSDINAAINNKIDKINRLADKLNILIAMNFEQHLNTFKCKAAAMELKAKNNTNYKTASVKANQFYLKLEQARDCFLNSTNNESIEKLKIDLKQNCKNAIKDAREILDNHREWKGAITKFLIDALSFLTRGLSDNKFSIFAKTKSSRMLDEFEFSVKKNLIPSP